MTNKNPRDTLQEECKKFPKESNICLYWSPRVGKTRGSLNCLSETEKKILVLSNTELIRDSWAKIQLENVDLKSIDLKSICYQSLKNEKEEYDVIIFDEADMLTDGYIDCLPKFKRAFVLTGTPTFRLNVQVKKLEKLTGKNTHVSSVSFQQAIDLGILPKPRIICLGLYLRDKPDQIYRVGKNKTKKDKIVTYKERFVYEPKFNKVIQCSEQQWNEMINQEIDKLKKILDDFKNKDEDEEAKERLKKCPLPQSAYENFIKVKGLERKNYLANLKNRYIQRLFKFFNLEDKRVILFANSVPQAEFIDQTYSIHSGKKEKKGEKNALELFNSGLSDRLISVGMLDRGIEIRNVYASIILQIPSSNAAAFQKASRNLLDDSPILIIPYFRGTKDEENMKKFTNNFDSKFIEFVNVANK